MASLPPRRASQRRPSPQTEPTPSSSFSATSEDSQTVLLNSPHSPTQAQEPSRQESNGIYKTTEVIITRSPEEAEPRKCWICFNDETEDDEKTSEWRSPCPCVLVAHEKCLLDWIADTEAPSSRRRAGGRQGKILCPQCKAEIQMQRPRSVVVDAVRLAERLAGTLMLPGAILFTGSAAYSTLALIGRTQVYQIFGTEEGLRILAPIYQAPDTRQISTLMRVCNDLYEHWRLRLGLPLIPTVLMVSRGTWADSFLPFLPLIFFVSSGRPQDEMLQFSWPPSAAFTVATLPYIRGIYNAYYERVWLPREQHWLKEVQPRAYTDSELDGRIELNREDPLDDDDDHGHDDLADGEDGDMVGDGLEVEVDFDLFADWNNARAGDNNDAAENPPVPIARGPGAPVDAQDDAAPAPNVPQQPQQPQQPRRHRVRRERNITFSTASLAETVFGALLFPSIAAAVGEALKQALPASWVTPPSGGKPVGFLQTRWGRSIVGGCLFVGVKDAVMLYVRWKMAQNHRLRRVVDYDKSKAKDNAKKTGRS